MELQPYEIKILHRLHFVGMEIEKENGEFSEEKLAQFSVLLTAFQNHPKLELQKIAELEDHIHPKMTAHHFQNLLRPIERILDKNLKDDQFLITTTDTKTKETEKLPLIFVLDNLRSSFNVGSIFRTAECFAIEKIICCGYTPTPDSSGVKKTAMGTDELVKWEHTEELNSTIQKLKDAGYKIIALETCEKAKDISAPMFAEAKSALIVGNERFGLMNETLSLADEVRAIPLKGAKNSLNVATSISLATYEWTKQWK